MIDRLLETWLNKANERSLQIPFAQWLGFQGHTVLHVSRHCAMELGKDVLSIDPEGVPCAFQLKGVDGRRMTMAKWREDLSRQIHPLVHGKIVHPSLTTSIPHRSFIVINGDFDEEVQREIDDFNRRNADDGIPERRLETIVKGQLFQGFKELQTDFWATNLRDLKTYLELFLEDGRGTVPKDKLAKLFRNALPFDEDRRPADAASARALVGCAVICAAAISQFSLAENHLAEFEAWSIFWCYSMGLAERWNIHHNDIAYIADLASEAMYTALGRLCDELIKRDDFIEGDPLIDRPVYRVRMTHLLGLMGLYGLWSVTRIQDSDGAVDYTHLNFAQQFCDKHLNTLNLWGEYAIPQFLAWNFFRKTYNAEASTDHIYGTIIEAICRKNAPSSEDTLANPYYDAESLLSYEFGLSRKPLEDSFSGKSHFLEALLHLFVRSNYKQRMKLLFPDVTRLSLHSFDPGEPWRFFVYRNWSEGTNIERFLVPPHRWTVLREEAAESSGQDLPARLKQFPIQYLALLLVMPYRANASGLRWFDSKMVEVQQSKSWLLESE